MLKLKNKKKGISLIETIISVSLFCIMTLAIIQLQITIYKIRYMNKYMNLYVSKIENVKCSIMNIYTYDEIKKFMNLNNNENVKYINNINDLQVFGENLHTILTEDKGSLPCMEIKAKEEKRILKIELTLYYQCFNNVKNIKMKIHKGNNKHV